MKTSAGAYIGTGSPVNFAESSLTPSSLMALRTDEVHLSAPKEPPSGEETTSQGCLVVVTGGKDDGHFFLGVRHDFFWVDV